MSDSDQAAAPQLRPGLVQQQREPAVQCSSMQGNTEADLQAAPLDRPEHRRVTAWADHNTVRSVPGMIWTGNTIRRSLVSLLSCLAGAGAGAGAWLLCRVCALQLSRAWVGVKVAASTRMRAAAGQESCSSVVWQPAGSPGHVRI